MALSHYGNRIGRLRRFMASNRSFPVENFCADGTLPFNPVNAIRLSPIAPGSIYLDLLAFAVNRRR